MPKKESTPTKTKKKRTSKTGKAIQDKDISLYFGEIQQNAYVKFINRQNKNEPGNELSDWLIAEKEIKAKYKSL